MRIFLFLIIVLLTLVASPGYTKEEPPSFSVLFVNPSIPDDPFWNKVQYIAYQAAAQLGIQLTVIYGDGNRFAQLEELKKYLDYRATPDYLILINYPGGAEQSLSLLSKYNIPFITLEQTITGPEQETIGRPGEHYKNWLGEIYHDNYRAGYMLAQALTKSLDVTSDRVKPILVNGHYGSESDSRSEGAKAFFKEHNIEVQQTVFASWAKDQAYEKTKKLLKRYPETNLIWSASDLMALGSETAMRSQKVSHPVAIGGFDWLDDALMMIDKGKLSNSIGGHFMMGAWALISLYDHHHQHSYWQTHQSLIFDLAVISKNNIKQYEHLNQTKDWSGVDFKGLTLSHSNLTEYPFLHRFDVLLPNNQGISSLSAQPKKPEIKN
jgi:ABC-type sugar transport system substrate-binding protein